MNLTRKRTIGLIFCFVCVSTLNAYAQSNKDTTVYPKIIQPPPPYDPTFVPDPDTTIAYAHPDSMPRFRGDLNKYFRDSLRYPQEAIEKKIQSTVYVTFIIERDGTVSNVKVLRSSYPILSTEVIRVVSTMPQWSPGKQNGKTVRVQYVVPIHFNLPPAPGGTMKK